MVQNTVIHCGQNAIIFGINLSLIMRILEPVHVTLYSGQKCMCILTSLNVTLYVCLQGPPRASISVNGDQP